MFSIIEDPIHVICIYFILITCIIFNRTCLHLTGGAWSSFSPGRGERWGRGSSGSRCVWRSLTSSNRRTGDWPRKWNKRWVTVCTAYCTCRWSVQFMVLVHEDKYKHVNWRLAERLKHQVVDCQVIWLYSNWCLLYSVKCHSCMRTSNCRVISRDWH